MRGIQHRLKPGNIPGRDTAWKVLFFVCTLLVVTSGIYLSRHTTPLYAGAGAPTARIVYGQPDFQSSTLYPAGPATLKNASALAADPHGGLYVVDYGNSRVLHFPATQGTGTAPDADQVYGQPDFTSSAVGKGPDGLNYPHGVAIDPAGGLYIADMFNNRVLHYPQGSTIADRVYGQMNFFENKANGGGSVSAHGLYQPQGIASDQSGLYVADSGNNRVLHFPSGSTIADQVYGQTGFLSSQSSNGPIGLNIPRDVAVDSTGLYVVDTGNNRILHYNVGNPVANFVYGQLDFFATQINQGQPHPAATTLNTPTGLTLDANSGLYVADRKNNRVIYYPPFAKLHGNDPGASRIYGQNNYITNVAGTTANTFSGPGAVAVNDGGEIFVLDIFNQRVLKFVLGLSVTKQPPANIKPGVVFDLSVTLQDQGSGAPFPDYNGPVHIQIKPGTGAAGVSIHGKTTLNAVQGVAHFTGLSINQIGSGYRLVVTSPGCAATETNAFAIATSPASSVSPTSIPDALISKPASSDPPLPDGRASLSIILVCFIVLLGSVVAIRVFRKRI